MSISFSCSSLVLNRSKSLSMSIDCKSLSNVADGWKEVYEHRLFQSGWGRRLEEFPNIGLSEKQCKRKKISWNLVYIYLLYSVNILYSVLIQNIPTIKTIT